MGETWFISLDVRGLNEASAFDVPALTGISHADVGSLDGDFPRALGKTPRRDHGDGAFPAKTDGIAFARLRVIRGAR
jgi:hypothetical protein